MNYSDLIKTFKSASLFDLYRLNVAMRNEMENPERIKAVYNLFKVGDRITYFDATQNTEIPVEVLEKKQKYVLVKDISTQHNWKIPYYMFNLQQVETDIANANKEKATRNHFRVGQCVGCQHEGREVTGVIIRLNQKTASILTKNQQRWRVSYSLLFKVIDAELEAMFDIKHIAPHLLVDDGEAEAFIAKR